MAKDKGGRPLIVDDNVLQKLDQAFSLGCTDLEACLYADISSGTLYNYQNANPKYLERKEQLKESMVLKARTIVHDSLQAKDEPTAKWYLERKKKQEFSLKVENEQVGNITIVLPTEKLKDI